MAEVRGDNTEEIDRADCGDPRCRLMACAAEPSITAYVYIPKCDDEELKVHVYGYTSITTQS